MNNIKNLRKSENLNQSDFAKLLNVTQATVSRWESNDMIPDTDILHQVADHFGCTIDFILGRGGAIKKGVKIPVLGKVQAGLPIEAIEDILDYEEITEELAATGEFFALQIKGESMEPRIKEGDVVIVRKQPDVESGDIAIVLVNGDEATVKKILKFKDGIKLIPLNPAFEPFYYTNKEIASLPVTILGKVVELRGKF